MLKFKDVLANLDNVNVRAELHGEDHDVAADIKVTMSLPNTCLDMFDKDLRPSLFEKGELADLDLVDDAEHQEMADQLGDDYMPVLKFPTMGMINWAYQTVGYRLIIEQGFSGEEDLVLINTKLDKFRFDCKQGGSVNLSFRIIAHPNADDLGQLCQLIQQTITLTLEPPAPGDDRQMDLEAA
jgi:hypothetical protein